MKDKNNIIWTKTILSVYRYLERIAGAIDKIILQSGLGCQNVSTQNYFLNNTYAVSQKIIDLSERKVTLINLKILIEDTLREIPKKDAEILILRFFDGKKVKDLCELKNLSMRTAFRKIDSAVLSFTSALTRKGYDTCKLENMLESEAWIKNVYIRFSSKNVDEIQLSKVFLAKAVTLNQSSFSSNSK